MKVRKIKTNLWARRFVSNNHWPNLPSNVDEKTWQAAARSKFVPKIHGLSFNDYRSQSRQRKVPHGRRALLTIPVDDLHILRKDDKPAIRLENAIRRRIHKDSLRVAAQTRRMNRRLGLTSIKVAV